MTLPSSNSSEKPWDKWALPEEPQDPLPSSSTSVVPSSSGGSNIPNAKRFAEHIEKHAQAVLQIRVTDSKRGTGCLIGGNLLITNHHVIANQNDAEIAEVRCWAVTEIIGTSTKFECSKLKLNPFEFFYTSPNYITDAGVQPAKENHLDFTIVAIVNDPFLTKLQECCFNLFSVIDLKPKKEICIIHHPDTIDDETQLRGGRERTYGVTHLINELSLHHDAIAQPGSSGSPIIDNRGRFIALHHQGDMCPDSLSRDYRYAVLTSAIVANLEKANISTVLKQQIADSVLELEKLVCDHELQDRWVDVPDSPRDFTGRDTELKDIQTKLANHQRVAITGLGGIGKSTIVHEFVKRNKVPYKVIQLIKGFDRKAIQNGLLELADNRKICGKDAEEKLENLKKHLEGASGFLLIFDGVDTRDGLGFLYTFLPRKMKSIVVTSRLSEDEIEVFNYSTIPVKEFVLNEARNYIEAATGFTEDAENLAVILGSLPLALRHATSYIKKQNINIELFLERYKKQKTALFGKKFPKPSDQLTVLKTWSINLGEMSATTLDLFLCCAYFGPHDIPVDLFEIWFEKFAPGKDMDTSIDELLSYSMMQKSKTNTFRIHELVKQVMRDYKSKGVNLTNCVEILNDAVGKFDYHKTDSWKYAKQIIPHIAHLVDIHPEHIPPLLLKDMYFYLGTFFLTVQEEYSRAGKYFTRALDIAIKEKSYDQLIVAAIIHGLGEFFNCIEDYNNALILYEKSLYIKNEFYRRKSRKIKTKVIGSNDYTSVVTTLQSIGSVLHSQKKLSEALEHYNRTLEIYVQSYGTKQHTDVASTLHAIGNVLQDQGRLDEALDCYNDALVIFKKVYGTDQNNNVASTLQAIGYILESQGELEKALDHYSIVLKITKKIYGTEQHTNVASTLYSIGKIFYTQRKLEDALVYFNRVLAIETKAYGTEEHPKVADTLEVIGDVLKAQGKFVKANEHYNQACAIRVKFCRAEQSGRKFIKLHGATKIQTVCNRTISDCLQKQDKIFFQNRKATKNNLRELVITLDRKLG
ncbi:MAG: hypothetical protein ChlgKO_08780 [Chlamydiales bacterium]